MLKFFKKPIVKIINKSTNFLPQYKSSGAACMDVRANLPENLKDIKYFGNVTSSKNEEGNLEITIMPKSRIMIPTGLYMQLPKGYQLDIRPRSGISGDYGVTVLNTPGTLDEDYTGELKIILVNHGNHAFKITQGDRIAQIQVVKTTKHIWKEVSQLDKTQRGSGGFGHSGKK